MIGQLMDASGFTTLASDFPDRTVITYDPRGLGRSTRKDGRVDNTPTLQANDVHAVIEALGAGPVEMFASSGGAVTALALLAAHPDDVITLVAHAPPLSVGQICQVQFGAPPATFTIKRERDILTADVQGDDDGEVVHRVRLPAETPGRLMGVELKQLAGR